MWLKVQILPGGLSSRRMLYPRFQTKKILLILGNLAMLPAVREPRKREALPSRA